MSKDQWIVVGGLLILALLEAMFHTALGDWLKNAVSILINPGVSTDNSTSASNDPSVKVGDKPLKVNPTNGKCPDGYSLLGGECILQPIT